MSCNAIPEILPSNRLSVAHLPDGKRLNLAEKHEWESDQQVVKTAKLVALVAVFLGGTLLYGLLGAFGLAALRNEAISLVATWVLLWIEQRKFLWNLESGIEMVYDKASWLYTAASLSCLGNLQQLGSCSEICWVFLGLEQQWSFLEFWNWTVSGILRLIVTLEFWVFGVLYFKGFIVPRSCLETSTTQSF